MPLRSFFLVCLLALIGEAAFPTRAATPKANDQEPPDALALRPLEWIPPFRQFRVVPVRFPETTPMAGVHSLAVGGDRVWISAGPWADTNLPTGTGRLWTFHPSDNRMEPVRGALEVHAIAGLLTRGRQLWLNIDGGLATLDPNTYTVDPFGSAQGFTSPRPVGVADTRRGLLALGDSGTLFRLSADQRTFLRHEGAAPVQDPRDPSPWRHFAGSGDWVVAATESSISFRHADAPQWTALRDALRPIGPDLQPATVAAVVGDGEGRFWVGTDAGLWLVEGESGRIESRERNGFMTVPGGLGIRIAPGMKPTAAAIATARERVQAGIRERMKLRARYARAAREMGRRLDPVTPRSRIPGEVLALASDRGFLWVATADPQFQGRSRVLLFHPGSRKWVGWFPIGFPVRCLAVDDRHLWIGVDARAARSTPLFAVEKAPILSVPSARWTPDEIDPADIAAKVAALPPSEQRVYSFFSGDHARVIALSEPETTDEEGLFLRAMSHDALGLDISSSLVLNLETLVRRFPNGLYAALATNLLPTLTGTRSAAPAVTVPSTVPTPTPTPRPDPAPAETIDAAALMERRDLNGDGKLNIVELRLWLGPKTELGVWDRNGDGAIDLTEISAVAAAAATALPTSPPGR